MKILVTGGAGFIGHHLCRRLLEDGHTVISMDNLRNYGRPHASDDELKATSPEELSRFKDRFIFKKSDITRHEPFWDLYTLRETDCVVHLAALAGVRPSIDEPEEYSNVNVTGTINVLEFCKMRNIKKFIFASSSSVYGNNSTPFNEDDRIDNPISPYAATKKAGELICYTYNHLFGINATCLRFFTVYGPRQRPDLAIMKFLKAIKDDSPIEQFGDGSSGRDYTYIDDIVDGIVSAIDKCYGYKIYNLGNASPVPLTTLIETCFEVAGKRTKVIKCSEQPGDVKKTHAEIAKAWLGLGYEPKTPLHVGIKKQWDWLNSQQPD